jgi:hypothetical protein
MDPPVSLPTASRATPPATAAAEPEEEPPVMCAPLQGLRAGGQPSEASGPTKPHS